MASILYLPSDNGLGRRFTGLLEKVVPSRKFEICRSIHELSLSLHKPRLNLKMAILIAPRKDDFLDILSLREFLTDVKIFLVVPDEEKDTIAQAHTLRPRFITQLDRDLSAMGDVLNRMLSLYDPPPVREESTVDRG